MRKNEVQTSKKELCFLNHLVSHLEARVLLPHYFRRDVSSLPAGRTCLLVRVPLIYGSKQTYLRRVQKGVPLGVLWICWGRTTASFENVRGGSDTWFLVVDVGHFITNIQFYNYVKQSNSHIRTVVLRQYSIHNHKSVPCTFFTYRWHFFPFTRFFSPSGFARIGSLLTFWLESSLLWTVKLPWKDHWVMEWFTVQKYNLFENCLVLVQVGTHRLAEVGL